MRRATLLAALLTLPIGCAGDDTSTTEGATTTASTSTSGASSSSTGGSGSGSSAGETSGGTSGGSTSSSTSTSSSSSSSSTGGDPVGPPDYPPPAGGCDDGSAPVVVGNGQLCAPFCAGEGAACPSEGLGDASSSCEPFVDSNQGSGDDCSMGQACPNGESCDGAACHSIVFWSCLIECGGGGSCPAPMICTNQNRCAYPL